MANEADWWRSLCEAMERAPDIGALLVEVRRLTGYRGLWVAEGGDAATLVVRACDGEISGEARQPGTRVVGGALVDALDHGDRARVIEGQALAPLKAAGRIVGLVVGSGDGDLERLAHAAPFLAASLARVHAERSQSDAQTLEGRLQLLVVHDLKNPLSIVKINVGLLLEDPSFSPAERTELLDEALAASDRLLQMLEDVATIRRAELQGLQLQPKQEELRTLVVPVVDKLQRNARLRGVDIACECVGGAVRVDVVMIARAFENIIGNAVRYSPDNGLVRVQALVGDDGQFHVSVENDGPHIPPAMVSRLFDKYGIVDAGTGSQRYGGRGLALYLCRMILEGHGGTIGVRNREGRGVRFELTLPRVG